MFSTPKVPCFLNGFSGHGDDPDSKELKLVFHLNPITPDLAIEVSPHMADRLFRQVNGEYEAAKEISKAQFSHLNIKMQNIDFFDTPDSAKAVTVHDVAISNLRANKEITGEFRFEFDAVVRMDKETMRLVEKYYKSTCFLTMDAVQMTLAVEPESPDKQKNEGLLQDAADGKSAGAGEESGRKRKKTA
jgi:protein-tyrosine-phosphatase